MRIQGGLWILSAAKFAVMLAVVGWGSSFYPVGVSASMRSQTNPQSKLTLEFVRVQPGKFQMGCSAGDTGCSFNEVPAHTVTITKAFDLGRYEVTQSQWETIMGANPSRFKGANRPVEQVSWADVQEFIGHLNRQSNGPRYRLPTEAEWEYAARAGKIDAGVANPEAIAWFGENSGGQTHAVGQKQPNPWGFYDMQGNVQEWVQDWLGNYSSEAQTDPPGAPTGNRRVLRGGSWEFCSGCVRLSVRGYFMPDFRSVSSGFRLVREVAP